MSNTEEILQHLYDSEIHVRIGWLWDGGVDYSFDSTGFDIWDSNSNNAQVFSTCSDSIKEAMVEIARHAAKEFPNSSFAKWWEE